MNANMLRLALVLVLAPLGAGCAVTRAQAPIERPPLEVPPAPPRQIEPAPVPVVAAYPPPVDDLPPPPPDPKPIRRTPRETSSRETQKPEPPKVEAAAPAEAPAPQAAPPAPTLRTPATADAAAVERRIRETLARAGAALKRIDYQRLTAPRKEAYERAKDFIVQSDTAMKASNFEIALEFAGKAETLARELQAR